MPDAGVRPITNLLLDWRRGNRRAPGCAVARAWLFRRLASGTLPLR
jgi:hypothetical protein